MNYDKEVQETVQQAMELDFSPERFPTNEEIEIIHTKVMEKYANGETRNYPIVWEETQLELHQAAMELDVTPLDDQEVDMELDISSMYPNANVNNAAKELGEYVQKWSKEHGLHTHILNHK